MTELLDSVRGEYCGDEDHPDVLAEPRCDKTTLKAILDKIEKGVVRKLLLEGSRADGRPYDQLRPISCEVGVLPRTHGL